jgi:hypothetical protein
MNDYETWLKKVWDNIAEDLKPDLVNVVHWVEGIKAALDSPIFDAVVAAWPGEKDDQVLAWLRKIADKVVEELGNVTGSELTKAKKQTIATMLTQEVTGLPFDQASTTIKVAYWNTVKFVS